MNFNPLFSTKECYRDDDLTRCLEDDLLTITNDLSGKAPMNHTHSQYALKTLQGVADDGTCEYSFTKASGADCLAGITAMPNGIHTVYSQSGVSNNPKTTEAWRMLVHKTGASLAWVLAFGSLQSIYTNYSDSNGWKGWRCLQDGEPQPLWTGALYLKANQTVTPTKALSRCKNGWLLLWSDYNPDTSSATDADYATSLIPKANQSGDSWTGKGFFFDVPRYSGSAQTSESRVIKRATVYDTKIVGHADNTQPSRDDVVLRAVYEW